MSGKKYTTEDMSAATFDGTYEEFMEKMAKPDKKQDKITVNEGTMYHVGEGSVVKYESGDLVFVNTDGVPMKPVYHGRTGTGFNATFGVQ